MPPLPQQTAQNLPKATVGGPAMPPAATPQTPQAQPTAAPVSIAGEDQLFSILDRSPLHDDQKTELYKAYTTPKNEDEFIKAMDGLGSKVTDDIRSTLYQMRFPQPKGMQQSQGIPGPQGPTTIGPQPWGIQNWLQNLQGDIMHGGQATLPGQVLHALGAQGLQSGTSEGAARMMGGPLIGPPDIAHGMTQMFDPGQRVAGAREMLGGAMETPGPLMGFMGAEGEALPTMAAYGVGGELGTRGLEYLGVRPDVADLASQIAMLAGGTKLAKSSYGKVKEFAHGGPEEGVRLGPRELGQPTATQAQAPPGGGPAEAINKMHRQAFGQEGGPGPVTEAGQTGAREVTGGVGRGEQALPVTESRAAGTAAPAERRGSIEDRRKPPGVELPKEIERRQIQRRVQAENAALAARQTPAFDDMRARDRGPGGRLSPEAIEADRQARAAEDARIKAAQPTYRPNMRTEPKDLAERTARQRSEGRITDQERDRLMGEQARLKAGLKPEEAPARFPETIGEQGQKGFRWSALSPAEQAQMMELADREKARRATAPTPPAPAAPKAPEAPTAPSTSRVPAAPTKPVREPAGLAPRELTGKAAVDWWDKVEASYRQLEQERESGSSGPASEAAIARHQARIDKLLAEVGGKVPKQRTIDVMPTKGQIPAGGPRKLPMVVGEAPKTPVAAPQKPVEARTPAVKRLTPTQAARAKEIQTQTPSGQPIDAVKAAEQARQESTKPTGSDFDKLMARVRRVGGSDEAINAIIKAADSKGGTAKERMDRAMEGLRNYGSQVWKESRTKGKDSKKGEAGFFSFRGKPTRTPSVPAAYKSSMQRLDAAVEKTSNMPIDKAAIAARDKVKTEFGLKNKLANAFMEMRASGKAFAHWYMNPQEGRKLSESGAIPEGIGGPPSTPSRGFKETFGTYQEGRQQSKYATGQFIDHIKRETTPMARHGITNYLQAGGDMDLLKERASKTTDPKLKRGYEVAQQLSEKEKRIADSIKQYFDDRLKEAMDLGVLDHGLENYVTQIWEKDSPFRRGILSDINAGKFQKSFRYAKERLYGSYFEGEQAGKVPTNKDIGFLVSAYENSLNEAIMARKFVKDMWSKAATDGRPLLVPEGKLARPIKDKGEGTLEGRAIPMRGPARGKLLSTELAEAMGIPMDKKALAEADKARTDTSDYVRIDHPAFRTWQFSTDGPDGKPIFAEADARVHPDIAKRLENMYTNSWFQQRFFGRAVLKGQGFLKQTLLGIPGFHYTQEGFHAMAHGVNPFSKDIRSGAALQNAMNDPIVQDGMRKGLMLYDHNASQKFGEGIRGIFGLIPVLGKETTIGNKVVGGWMEGMQEHLFQTYIPGLKAEMFKKALGRNLERYKGDIAAGKVTKPQLVEITAAQANAAFGELNYDWMGRNRTAQDIFRLAALAPDFLEARARFLGQAIRPYGAEQRAALLIRLGVVQYATARIANAVLNDGDPIWDPEYMFKVKIGDKAYGFRSIPGDMQHLWKDPAGFSFFRMSPLAREGVAEFAKFYGGKEHTWKDIMKETAPIPLQGLIQDYFMKGVKDKESANSFLQAIGIQAQKYRTPEERERLEKMQEKRQKMLRGEKTGLRGPRTVKF